MSAPHPLGPAEGGERLLHGLQDGLVEVAIAEASLAKRFFHLVAKRAPGVVAIGRFCHGTSRFKAYPGLESAG